MLKKRKIEGRKRRGRPIKCKKVCTRGERKQRIGVLKINQPRKGVQQDGDLKTGERTEEEPGGKKIPLEPGSCAVHSVGQREGTRSHRGQGITIKAEET